MSVEARLRMARGWQLAGRVDAAISAYEEVVATVPTYDQGYIELARLHLGRGDLDDSFRYLRLATEHKGHANQIHKITVDALVARGGISEAFAHYGLSRIDDRPLAPPDAPVVACLIVRNEALRLPYVIDYHRKLGVDHFFVVDNGSEDGSVEWLRQTTGVNAWSTTMAYGEANWGLTWMEVVLRAHRPRGWCLFVDADELLTYPGDDRWSIPELTGQLEAEGVSALPAVMLDLYSDRAVADTVARPGQDPREVCQFFDRRWHHYVTESHGPFLNQRGYWGGARQRVFPKVENYYLSKVPLLRYDRDRILTGGQHYTNGPANQISSRRAALIHTKFFSSLPDGARQEIDRGEHYDGAVDYRHYVDRFEKDEGLSLFDPEESVRYEGTAQLVALGVCREGP